MAGIAMPKPDAQAAQREKERTSLLDVMELATLFFQDQLQAASGAKARAYLRERGLTGRTIETFRLGYAPDSRNALKEHLASKGVPKDQIEACGWCATARISRFPMTISATGSCSRSFRRASG